MKKECVENSANHEEPQSKSRKMETMRYSWKMKIGEILQIKPYLNDIEKYPLLSPDEEAYLFQLYEAGDEKAFEKIIQSNLRFVIYVAKSLTWYWVPIEDLIQEWNIWLIEAAKKFNHTKWFKLISYAVHNIMNRMQYQIMNLDKSFTSIPRWSVRKIQKFIENFFSENQRYPTHEELNEFCIENNMWYDFAWYYETYTKKFRKIPLNHNKREYQEMWIDPERLKEINKDNIENTKYVELIPDDWENIEQNLNNQDIAKLTEELLSKITEYEREVIKMYFWIWRKPMTLDEIALRFWLTRERVRQIKEKWIKRLKRMCEYCDLYTKLTKTLEVNLWTPPEKEESKNVYPNIQNDN